MMVRIVQCLLDTFLQDRDFYILAQNFNVVKPHKYNSDELVSQPLYSTQCLTPQKFKCCVVKIVFTTSQWWRKYSDLLLSKGRNTTLTKYCASTHPEYRISLNYKY